MITRPTLRAALLAALRAPGCIEAIDPLDPMVGGPLVERCVNEDSDPGRDVSFSREILPMLRGETLQPGCGCHMPDNPNPVGLERTGLDLSSHAAVLRGGMTGGARNVIPGAPCESVLWQKVSPGPPFGARMPFDGPPFLDATARRLLADWIAEGALDDR